MFQNHFKLFQINLYNAKQDRDVVEIIYTQGIILTLISWQWTKPKIENKT